MFGDGFHEKHGFTKIQHVLIRVFRKIRPHKSISVLYQSVRHTALSAANRQNPTSREQPISELSRIPAHTSQGEQGYFVKMSKRQNADLQKACKVGRAN